MVDFFGYEGHELSRVSVIINNYQNIYHNGPGSDDIHGTTNRQGDPYGYLEP